MLPMPKRPPSRTPQRLVKRTPQHPRSGSIPIGLVTALCLFAFCGLLASENPLETMDEPISKPGLKVPNLELFDSPSSAPSSDSQSDLTMVTLHPELSLDMELVEATPTQDPSSDSVFEGGSTGYSSVSPISGKDASTSITLLRHSTGEVETYSLDQYLWSVVAAEMPVSFPLEALKAQVVAARTYTTQRIANPKHSNAQICDSSNCCQAYVSVSNRLSSWGSDATRYQEILSRAVAETDGLHVLYQGKPIDALFFSSSPGYTLQSQEVWVSAVPYLKGVSSPEGANVPNYRSQVVLSKDEVASLVRQKYSQASLGSDPNTWFTSLVPDSIGGVAQMNVGGVSLTGGQLRGLFSLRSSYFTVSYANNQFTFSVTGYGHNVGMSQYGAKSMAESGSSFEEILTWYYTGTTVSGYG